MSNDQDQVTFGDKNVETSQFDRYKGRKGMTDRFGILSPTLYRGWRYYHEKTKTSFKAPTNPEVLAACRKAIGEPEQRFGLVLFQYTTDENGNLLDDSKCQGKVKLWAISESRYEEMSNLHRSWPLLDAGFGQPQVDLQFKCTEEQYQRGTFVPCPAAHWKSKQAWYDALKQKEAAALPRLKMTLGKSLSDLEIMELIGTVLPSQTGGTDRAGDVDLSDIMD